ncbi:MAG: hypothetical protein J3K34DRAFT_430875 [Monoraphidium minutum]|nr:MAG: hypothetical protein J3K34DRAFT_430875 [Monoraphidium minutum]
MSSACGVEDTTTPYRPRCCLPCPPCQSAVLLGRPAPSPLAARAAALPRPAATRPQAPPCAGAAAAGAAAQGRACRPLPGASLGSRPPLPLSVHLPLLATCTRAAATPSPRMAQPSPRRSPAAAPLPAYIALLHVSLPWGHPHTREGTHTALRPAY